MLAWKSVATSNTPQEAIPRAEVVSGRDHRPEGGGFPVRVDKGQSGALSQR